MKKRYIRSNCISPYASYYFDSNEKYLITRENTIFYFVICKAGEEIPVYKKNTYNTKDGLWEIVEEEDGRN